MAIKSKYSKVQNFFPYVVMPEIRLKDMYNNTYANIIHKEHGGSINPSKNLDMSLTPVNKPRVIQDVLMWRESIRIAEDAMLPFRYPMQAAFKDTVLELFVRSCIDRREDLSLLRKFEILDNDDEPNMEWYKYFKKSWFKTWMKYTLGAKWYGYTLISMGDIKDGMFSNIVMIPREHVSPDRKVVANVPSNTTGENFIYGIAPDGTPYADSHIWIDTPDEHGLAACGYGKLYETTFYAIGLKNNITYNIQFCEIFGMPYRQLKTNKVDDDNLNALKGALSDMGSLGAIITSKEDELVFFDSSKGGGYKSFGDLQSRMEDLIAQDWLGHADALSSTPGKIGGQQGGELSAQQQALTDIQSADGEFLMEQINGKLFPFMRRNGIMIPEDLRFEFTNDTEDKEVERIRNTENKTISEIVANMAKGGINVEPTPELEEIMRLKLTKAQVVKPTGGNTI